MRNKLEQCCLLGCDAVEPDRNLLTFRRNVLPQSLDSKGL
jgi:hypothetical protein